MLNRNNNKPFARFRWQVNIEMQTTKRQRLVVKLIQKQLN